MRTSSGWLRALPGTCPGIAITASAALLPRIGEYERASTASVNGYVGPVIERYLDLLTGRLRAAGFRAPVFVMQSNGGLASVEAIRRRAVQTILSGPAGGVVAGRAAGSVSSEAAPALGRTWVGRASTSRCSRTAPWNSDPGAMSGASRSVSRQSRSTRSVPVAVPSPGSMRAVPCGWVPAVRARIPGRPATAVAGTSRP